MHEQLELVTMKPFTGFDERHADIFNDEYFGALVHIVGAERTMVGTFVGISLGRMSTLSLSDRSTMPCGSIRVNYGPGHSFVTDLRNVRYFDVLIKERRTCGRCDQWDSIEHLITDEDGYYIHAIWCVDQDTGDAIIFDAMAQAG